ncbi:PqiC family protein [Halomonas sp. 328]|uniref:PqiC family protein n=1 Tax=Halomonas sp. 328 TaxID=2776704 RepID=UPI0018A70D28|nr:ABC-type transport auxiliary lipoprotein family protein [Halomonas sp. 328]MBF8222135.1 membrane integrity-associated transporter subunit PqiC [Halomonas sp. 328]
MMRLILPLLLLALLAGCAGGGSATQRYALPGPEAATVAAAETRLLIAPLQLVEYLDQEGIVLQLDDISRHQAREHRWIEAPGPHLARGLRDRLAERLPQTQVALARGDDAPAPRLRLEVERFEGRYDGMAIAAGSWRLASAEGSPLAQGRFHAERPLAGDGYPALVRALGESWDAVADQVAEALAPRLATDR